METPAQDRRVLDRHKAPSVPSSFRSHHPTAELLHSGGFVPSGPAEAAADHNTLPVKSNPTLKKIPKGHHQWALMNSLGDRICISA
jgi:hypothetical protein